MELVVLDLRNRCKRSLNIMRKKLKISSLRHMRVTVDRFFVQAELFNRKIQVVGRNNIESLLRTTSHTLRGLTLVLCNSVIKYPCLVWYKYLTPSMLMLSYETCQYLEGSFQELLCLQSGVK